MCRSACGSRGCGVRCGFAFAKKICVPLVGCAFAFSLWLPPVSRFRVASACALGVQKICVAARVCRLRLCLRLRPRWACVCPRRRASRGCGCRVLPLGVPVACAFPPCFPPCLLFLKILLRSLCALVRKFLAVLPVPLSLLRLAAPVLCRWPCLPRGSALAFRFACVLPSLCALCAVLILKNFPLRFCRVASAGRRRPVALARAPFRFSKGRRAPPRLRFRF